LLVVSCGYECELFIKSKERFFYEIGIKGQFALGGDDGRLVLEVDRDNLYNRINPNKYLFKCYIYISNVNSLELQKVSCEKNGNGDNLFKFVDNSSLE
jgi:hypothetical protein